MNSESNKVIKTIDSSRCMDININLKKNNEVMAKDRDVVMLGIAILSRVTRGCMIHNTLWEK